MKAAANNKKAAAPQTEANSTAAALEGSELGEVKVHENVIASLVRKAALSVEGVSRLAGSSLVDNIAEFVGNRRMARAITIEMDDNNRVMIEIKLVLKIGFNIPEVAPQVQKAVIEGVEKVTGMTVTKVGVLFQDIDDAAPEGDSDDEDAEIDSIPMN
ncbi:MAG: Asp23/Gls24 family envelope stress response protein [Lentisphaeria bacterium]|nr:Asp23/Gls24 family envelope stress response protein [Lentisphaeria bacterium]